MTTDNLQATHIPPKMYKTRSKVTNK